MIHHKTQQEESGKVKFRYRYILIFLLLHQLSLHLCGGTAQGKRTTYTWTCHSKAGLACLWTSPSTHTHTHRWFEVRCTEITIFVFWTQTSYYSDQNIFAALVHITLDSSKHQLGPGIYHIQPCSQGSCFFDPLLTNYLTVVVSHWLSTWIFCDRIYHCNLYFHIPMTYKWTG